MGFAIVWCAVPEADAEELLRDLALSPTDKADGFPDFLFATAQLDTGWRLVWFNEFSACPFLKPKQLAAVSKKRDILLCQVEEHCMGSSAELWSGGKRKWSIFHLGDRGARGPRSLETDGVLPESFPAIKQEMEETQDEADAERRGVDYIFEIPLKVAESLVGFKHDQRPTHVIGEKFTEMVCNAPKVGFFQRLLGRR